MERREPADRDADERRLERQRHERADGQADVLALEVDGHDCNPRWDATHQFSELIAFARRPIIGRMPPINRGSGAGAAEHGPLLGVRRELAGEIERPGAVDSQKTSGVTPGPTTAARYAWPPPRQSVAEAAGRLVREEAVRDATPTRTTS